MLGVLKKDEIESKLEGMKNKWGNVDLGDIKNFDDLKRLIMSGAIDLDSLCKLVPNIEKEGTVVTVRATPTSFPDIDPAAILKGEKLPEYRKPKIDIRVGTRAKKQAEEFLNLELPDFNW